MKGDFASIKAHKWFGRIEGLIFFAITGQCLYMFAQKVLGGSEALYTPSGVWAHTWFGGFLAVALVTTKLLIARIVIAPCAYDPNTHIRQSIEVSVSSAQTQRWRY